MPLFLINSWLIDNLGYNFAVYFMAVILIFSALYAAIFMYRVFREVMELKQSQATASYLIPLFVCPYFITNNGTRPFHYLNDVPCNDTLYCRYQDEEGVHLKAWQSFVLLFFTTGMATSNAAKTMLAGLFTNGWKGFLAKSSFSSVLSYLFYPSSVFVNTNIIPLKCHKRK